MAAGQPTKYKPELCDELVKYMAKGYSYSTFSVDRDFSVTSMYEWEKVHPEWKEAKKEGFASGMKFFESLLTNATMGILPQSLKDLDSKGINLSAVIFALKTRFHKEYGEKVQTDHISSDGSMKIEFVKPDDNKAT